MDWFPDEPEVPPEQRGAAPSPLRYEDVSQDGRLMLLALPHVLGDALWRTFGPDHPLPRIGRAGLIPVLTRFVIEGGDGPHAIREPLRGEGRWQLAHTRGADGEVERLLLNMGVNVGGALGRTYGPPPERAGQVVPAGRLFAEHVFARLFAPPAERRVRAFDVAGLPAVPPARWTWRPLEAVLAPPPGARALDEQPVPDAAPVVFGLHHTDSNQHVNSLVYPRLFQDAALRRFAAHGAPPRLLPRRLEVAYRKPCFAGDRARILVRAFARGPDWLAIGAFVPDGDPAGRPLCVLQAAFAP